MKASIFSALAEPNRFQIVELLQSSPLTVGEISERLGIRQPQASKHLRVLLDAGIVDVIADANRRIYKLRQEPFQEMDDWLISYRHLWEDRFDRLDAYLQVLQNNKKPQSDEESST
ncbi:ArsR/SmtB family transcription factor [Paenibacillus sp. GCM10027629]|uniref:ArsR/SmtB family transcription factor n=1 Tax=Paenibacillus sp. GCM10027629 TaxID=3273414 RepID=UPI00362DF751